MELLEFINFKLIDACDACLLLLNVIYSMFKLKVFENFKFILFG